MSIIYPERHWDYVVKQTYGGLWKARNQYGLTLATAAANTSLETLVNACMTDKGSTPGLVLLAPNGTSMNIDGSIQIPSYTTLKGVWGPNQVTELYLQSGSNCDMIQPTANNVVNVAIHDLALDGNRDGNAGDIDCISWEMGTTLSSSWKMLDLKNLWTYYADRDNIRISSTGGNYATVLLRDIKSFYPDEESIHFIRAFDAQLSGIRCSSMAFEKGSASIQLHEVYVSGGYDHGIRVNDLGDAELGYGPYKNIWTNIRIDNVLPGADADDAALYLNDVKWLEITGMQITNLNTNATDKARYAVRLVGDYTEHVDISDTMFVRDPAYTTKYWRYGIYEEASTTECKYRDIDFTDAVSPDADDAEIMMRAGAGSSAFHCTRDGGQIARTRYV